MDLDLDLLDKKIDQMMPELGFKADDNDRLVASFSGGWQMRMCLGKLLLQEPDLLLLDEVCMRVCVLVYDTRACGGGGGPAGGAIAYVSACPTARRSPPTTWTWTPSRGSRATCGSRCDAKPPGASSVQLRQAPHGCSQLLHRQPALPQPHTDPSPSGPQLSALHTSRTCVLQGPNLQPRSPTLLPSPSRPARPQEVPMVIVSHDREFLDQLCTKIVETERGVATTYPGNYTQYVNSKVRPS